MSTLIGKKFLPLNRFRPPPLQWKVYLLPRQYLPLILMFHCLRKGKRSRSDHHISYFVLYDHLTPSFRQFALSLFSVSLLRSYEEAILIPAWKQVMDEEMDALISRET